MRVSSCTRCPFAKHLIRHRWPIVAPLLFGEPQQPTAHVVDPTKSATATKDDTATCQMALTPCIRACICSFMHEKLPVEAFHHAKIHWSVCAFEVLHHDVCCTSNESMGHSLQKKKGKIPNKSPQVHCLSLTMLVVVVAVQWLGIQMTGLWILVQPFSLCAVHHVGFTNDICPTMHLSSRQCSS